MIDGIYSIAFRGAADWGIGLLMLRRGTVTGVDVAGVQYDGTFDEQPESITIHLKLIVPPGVTLVQGSVPRPVPYDFEIHTRIPKSTLGGDKPHLVETGLGPVNVAFRKLRDIGD